EQIRFGDRLKAVVDAEAETLDACVPYLILQPLVENAIRHGIARRSTAGRLDLRLWRDGARLCIEVDNDGAADAAGADAAERQAGGVGLANIGERLAKLYPGQHRF